MSGIHFGPRLEYRSRIRIFKSNVCGSSAKSTKNEPTWDYARGSAQRKMLNEAIAELKSDKIDIPAIIGGKSYYCSNPTPVYCPYNNSVEIARIHSISPEDIKEVVKSSMETHKCWTNIPNFDRYSIFLKAAEMLSKPEWRMKMNAATIYGQGKTFFQAEIDSACELIDFWRYNSYFAAHMEDEQPHSVSGVLNYMKYYPLEGFIAAISPFNFTAIGGNLATAPAIVGNTVVWKPSNYAVLSNYFIIKLLQEAGLPDGVINFVPMEPNSFTEGFLADENFAGIHFTGSTAIFRSIWSKIGENIHHYKAYPRIVGETGGKGFIFAHNSADIEPLATALIKGAFEYAGQKCSASSRAYIPQSIWNQLSKSLLEKLAKVKMGNPEEFDVTVSPVIHQGSFDRCKRAIELARNSNEAEVWYGGHCDSSVGYFVEPTIVLAKNPHFQLMREEIFGPVLTIYIYSDDKYEETLEICDKSTSYGLTGAIWANDRRAIVLANKILIYSCGNHYINDRPTGAIVGQQPFGGGRLSGTNDKAGSYLNLLRWVNAKSFKENLFPTIDFT